MSKFEWNKIGDIYYFTVHDRFFAIKDIKTKGDDETLEPVNKAELYFVEFRHNRPPFTWIGVETITYMEDGEEVRTWQEAFDIIEELFGYLLDTIYKPQPMIAGGGFPIGGVIGPFQGGQP